MKNNKIQLFHATRLEKIPSIMKYGLLTSTYEGVTYFTDNPIASWQWTTIKFKIYPENINFNFGIVHVEIDENDPSLYRASDHSSNIYSILKGDKFNVYEYGSDLSPENLKFYHIFETKDGLPGFNEYHNCFENKVVSEIDRELDLKNLNDFEIMLSYGLNVIKI